LVGYAGMVDRMARHIDQMVVIITGASSGIGLALAEQLSAKGARLVLAARRLGKLEEVNAKLGGRHLPVACDVAIPEQCEQLIAKAIEHFGRIDTLVCNAGYGMVRTVAQTSSQEMRDMFATNVFGTVDCVRPAVAAMKKQNVADGWRGQIMIVTSSAARRGLPYFGCYAATKFAQLGFSEALRVELHDQKIAVTSVHPIGTSTDFFNVAEQRSGTDQLPPDSRKKFVQTPAQVARRMVRAMIHPTVEVWPFDLARFGLAFCALFPSVVDWAMGIFFRQIENWNRGRKE